MEYRFETYKRNDGAWYLSKVVAGECVFFISTKDESKMKGLFERIVRDQYDPSKDKRRHGEENPAELYAAIIKQTKGKNRSVTAGPYFERCLF